MTQSVAGRLKRQVGNVLKNAVVFSPMPLAVQAWAIRQLPIDPWPKSLAYQQCLANRLIDSHGPAVQDGPLKGMVCIRDASEGCLVPKLLGCYEEELAPAVGSF